MKKLLPLIFASAVALSASAELNGNGYYRAKNYNSNRYIHVLDNKGSLNYQATTADLGAIELYKDHEAVISDPATVVYVCDLTGQNRDFDLRTQGTGVVSIIDHAVSIIKCPSIESAYYVFGRQSGVARYIVDGSIDTSTNKGTITDNPGPTDRGAWYFIPVSADSDEYFGVKPEFNIGDDYYASFYAGFPFSFASEGMSAYVVTKVNKDMVAMMEVTGTIPEGTPVFIKCKSATPAGNKLNVGGTGTAPYVNQLKGVYFNNTRIRHVNRVAYDKETMRVLGRMSDGSLGFITADYDYLPRNTSYLTVPKGTPSELKIVPESEFTGLNMIDTDSSSASVSVDGRTLHVTGNCEYNVYTIAGHRIYSGSAQSFSLPSPGIYLVKTPQSVSKVVAK